MSTNNDFNTDTAIGRLFTSYDGQNLLISRVDGSLFLEFNDGSRYGIAYFEDQFNKSLEEVDRPQIKFKSVAIQKNKIILTQNNDHLYIGKFDMYNLTNIEKVDDTFSKGNPSLEWECKENPYKTDIETYKNIGFIDENNIFVVSELIDKTDKLDKLDIKIYIYNIQTDTWNVINDMKDTDTFNWIDNPMGFFLIHSDNTSLSGNLITIAIENEHIQKKTINIKDFTNFACSRQTKKFSKFDDITKTLNIMSYKDLFENNIIWEKHPITFLDEMEFYTNHNMTNDAYILTTNKNIYVKLIGTDDWKIINFTSTDTYIINNIDDTFYDTTSIFWNNIFVENNSIVITSLCGNTYHMKIKEDGFKFTQAQLPMIFGTDEIFNIIFQNAIFMNKFDKKFRIEYFSDKK
jgi:hypothetical protein